MISFGSTGDFSKTLNFLNGLKKNKIESILDKYGEEGVQALSANTPKDSGTTSSSWYYKIKTENGKASITWYNSHVVNGVPIAIILQYGHGTKNGGYINGRDYINPAMKPIFEAMANEAWKEVIKE